MVMQMLAAGGMQVLSDAVRAPDHDNPRGYYEYEPVKRTAEDAAWVAAAAGKAVKVIHLLLPHLPRAHRYRVLFVRREISEVLASQANMLERNGRRGADLPPGRLAEVFEAQVARALEWASRQPNVSLLELRHGSVVECPAMQAARINEFLGGTLDEASMATAVAPQLYRHRHTER